MEPLFREQYPYRYGFAASLSNGLSWSAEQYSNDAAHALAVSLGRNIARSAHSLNPRLPARLPRCDLAFWPLWNLRGTRFQAQRLIAAVTLAGEFGDSMQGKANLQKFS